MKCESCFYYVKDEIEETRGSCHYDPPVTFMMMMQGPIKGSSRPAFHSIFRTVAKTAFCHNHKPTEVSE